MSKLTLRAETVDIVYLRLRQDFLAKNVLITTQRDFRLGNSLFILDYDPWIDPGLEVRKVFDTDSLREYTVMFFRGVGPWFLTYGSGIVDRVFLCSVSASIGGCCHKAKRGAYWYVKGGSDSWFLVGSYFGLVIDPKQHPCRSANEASAT